jgi:hypothetical protein
MLCSSSGDGHRAVFCRRAARFLIHRARSARGILSGATLAWSEPLTALPRSARSRVSSSRSLCKAPTRTPRASLSGYEGTPATILARAFAQQDYTDVPSCARRAPARVRKSARNLVERISDEHKNEEAASMDETASLFGWAYSPAARRRLVRRGAADFFLLIGTTPTSAAGSSSLGAVGTARGCL